MKKNKLKIAALFVLLPIMVGALNWERPDADPFVKIKAKPHAYTAINTEPRFSSQTHFNHLNRTNVLDTYRGEDVTVAIIDSGLNPSHEDFFNGTYTNILDTSASLEELGEYYSNVLIQTVADHGRNIITDDEEGHGTNVASTVAALVNGKGTAGVAAEANLMVLKIDFYLSTVDAAIRYATDNGADVINLSLGAYNESFTDGFGDWQEGYPGTDVYLQDAIDYAYNRGVTVVAAAGNEDTNVHSYPAANDNVIGVGALASDSSSTIAYYSNSGTHNVDLVAPGTVYVAGVPTATSYNETQGTSFSSPIVAAAAALYKGKVPNATPAQIEQKLKETAFDLGAAGVDPVFGHGRLDLSALLIDKPLTGISLNPSSLTLRSGETSQLVTEFTPVDATNKNVIYISNDDSIATVNEDTGLVTAVSPGTTQIGVLSEDGGFEDTITVTVIAAGANIPVSNVSIGESTINIGIGQSKTLDYVLTPSNAKASDLNFVSSNPSIISITNNGLMTANALGSATITVSAKEGSGTDSITVNSINVIDKTVTDVFTSSSWSTANNNWTSIKNGNQFNDNRVQITSGSSGAGAKSRQVYNNIHSITLGYSTNASKGSGDIKVSIISENNPNNEVTLTPFSVSTSGGVTRRETTAFIPSSLNTGYIKFIVNCSVNSIYIHDIKITYQEVIETPTPVSGVEITSADMSLLPNAQSQIYYNVLPANATNKNVTFTSSNSAVATVSSTGLVRAIAPGNAIITITTNEGGFTDSKTIIVNEAPVINDTLSLDTTEFKTSYKFGETLALSTLKASFTTNGVTTLLSGNELTLVSGDTKTLGQVTLTFTYENKTATTQINVTNIGMTPTPVGGSVLIDGNPTSGNLTTTASTIDEITFGSTVFAGSNLRSIGENEAKQMMINSGGHIRNVTALPGISSLTITYRSGGSSSAKQEYRFSSSPLESATGTVTHTTTDSTGNKTVTVNAPAGMSFFRLDVSNKNLQALITINYGTGETSTFTPSEQANAFVDYFMEKTALECLVGDVKATTWNELENEYQAMSDDAKSLVMNSSNSDFIARYNIIVIKYAYSDYLNIVPERANSQQTNITNNFDQSVLILLSAFIVIGLSTFALYRYANKEHKA